MIPPNAFPARRTVAAALFGSLVAVLIVAVFPARFQFSTGDEGWLWYGMQRMLAGEWPLRDFNSYDPGRYLFLAAWARLWRSDHIAVMRCGLALVEWLALVPAVLLVAAAVPVRINSLWLLILIACTLSLWMAPRHKIFDIGATVWMTCALACLISSTSRSNCTVAGATAALLWWIGRNHLLYGSLSLLLGWCWAATGSHSISRVRQLFYLLRGYLLGLMPMLVLLLAVHGYALAYWHNAVVRLFEIGSTNLPLAVPWPWKHFVGSNITVIEQRATGLGFVLVPTMPLIAFVLAVIGRKRKLPSFHPAVIAAAITSLAWAHQAFSRADVSHLAQASLPMGIVLLALPWSFPGASRVWAGAICWSAFFIITFAAMVQLNPAFQAYVQPQDKFSWENINGEMLYVPASTTAEYNLAAAVVKNAGSHSSVLFEPYFPGLYAAFRLRCPVFDAYPLYPKTVAEQRQSIDELNLHRTDWAVIWPYRIDGRLDLGLDRTDPQFWNFIMQNFQPADAGVSADGAMVLHRISKPKPNRLR